LSDLFFVSMPTTAMGQSGQPTVELPSTLVALALPLLLFFFASRLASVVSDPLLFGRPTTAMAKLYLPSVGAC
jgi:hypothetical protein